MRTAFAVLLLAGLAACQNISEPTRAVPLHASFASSSMGGGGTCTLANGKTASTGFDQYGYNRCAHNFVGTFAGYCAQRSLPADCAGVPGDTRLNMKWNEGWDVGNATDWALRPYDAWLDNEIRGADFSEHFKTKWDAVCAAGGTTSSLGGPCIWGQFAVLMDQGTEDGQHVWWTKLSAGGFGS